MRVRNYGERDAKAQKQRVHYCEGPCDQQAAEGTKEQENFTPHLQLILFKVTV